MKIRERLIVAFLIIIIIPVILFSVFGSAIMNYQVKVVQKYYDVETDTLQILINPMQILNGLTAQICDVIVNTSSSNPEKFEDMEYIRKTNSELKEKYSYLVVRKEKQYIYVGNENEFDFIKEDLPEFHLGEETMENGFYLEGESSSLVKQQDFYFSDGEEGSIFVITATNTLLPHIKDFCIQIVVAFIAIIFFTAIVLIFWIYESIIRPLAVLRSATNEMSKGNLDYPMDFYKVNNEIGELCRDFEKMRKQIKVLMEEKIQYEETTRELMSNISHDLKTPLTAIKGYAEGMLDGVADTKEKREKYLKTIYNKATDMTYLIEELSFFSKMDCNGIPYQFVHLNMEEYFSDCVGELALDLEVKKIDLGYFNYVDKSEEIIVDAEQLKRVINNIIGNSVKYMDKKKGIINFRIQDQYDCVQIEIEDNGKGIAKNEISYIFDRFYRTDASRNSSQGGTGLGLSICRKIIEDHGGRIWASSKEGVGTSIFFTLKKYNKQHMEQKERVVNE